MTRYHNATNESAKRAPGVLVVDDDPDMLHVIQSVLEDEGLAVSTASDGGQALELAARQPPDLVVLDMTLPVLSGEQVAARLRQTRGAALPILAVTADGRAAEKARRMGAYAYLSKPFDLTDLVTAVRRVLH